MTADPSAPASVAALVDAASRELSRVMTDLAHQLETLVARQREEAVALARAEAEQAVQAAREAFERDLGHTVADTEARLRAEFAELRRTDEADVEARARQLADTRMQAALADLEARAHAAAEQAAAEAQARTRAEAEVALRAARDAAEARIASLMRLVQQSGQRAADHARRQADEREGHLLAAERLLRAIERLDACSSLGAVLDALGESVAAEAPRTLLLVRHGDALRGWHASGIARSPADIRSLQVPVERAGALGDAVRSAVPVVAHANTMTRDTGGAFGFLELNEDQAGLAVPVIVDGVAVAVIYADDGAVGDREVPASWPEAIQVLARHAARCLEAITARRAQVFGPVPRETSAPSGHAVGAQAGQGAHREGGVTSPPVGAGSDAEAARRFARLLISEIRLYHEAEVEAGRRAGDLRRRLGPQIARARHQYEQRVPASLAGRDDYFQQELVRTLADGDPSRLGGAEPGAIPA